MGLSTEKYLQLCRESVQYNKETGIYSRAHNALEVIQYLKKKPLCLVLPAPSLDKHWKKILQHPGFILCADVCLQAMRAHGIEPDYVVTTDPGLPVAEYFRNYQTDVIAASTSALHAYRENIGNLYLYTPTETNYEFRLPVDVPENMKEKLMADRAKEFALIEITNEHPSFMGIINRGTVYATMWYIAHRAGGKIDIYGGDMLTDETGKKIYSDSVLATNSTVIKRDPDEYNQLALRSYWQGKKPDYKNRRPPLLAGYARIMQEFATVYPVAGTVHA